jgi:hypothetical protein
METNGTALRPRAAPCQRFGGFFSKPLQDAVYAPDATPFNHYFIPDGKSFAAMYPNHPARMIAETRKNLDWGQVGRASCRSRSNS